MAATTTPNYEIDYNDERFTKVENDYQTDLTETQNIYDGMISQSDKFYQDQIQASKDWANTQQQIQQEQTDFAIEKIEQEKQKAEKDYIKEQSGAYVDWQKQSNRYGAEAERMASVGLSNTGYSESSQVAMYNQYQNRVATARESFNYAVLNYNNAIKDAQLQNNAALAEIAYTALQQQLELSLQGFQYKNSLITEKADKIIELKNTKWQKEMAILDQMNTENALAEEVRQFNENLVFQEEQAQLDRDQQWKLQQAQQDFQAREAQIERDHEAKLAKENQDFQIKLEGIKDENERNRLKQEHEYNLAIINAETKAKKEVAQYEYNLAKSSSSTTNNAKISKKNTKQQTETGNAKINTYKDLNPISAMKTFSGTTYNDAVTYLKINGYSNLVGSIMTKNEWDRRRASYQLTGKGSDEVTLCSSYTEYLQDYVRLKTK